MIFVMECIIFCLFFTIMVYLISRDPIKTLYNYPPKIIERVQSLKHYQGKIPTQKNKITAKIGASLLFLFIMILILRYVNVYTSFLDAFLGGFFLWTIVNLYDLLVLDILWFCHDPYFILKGTEDMKSEYHNYFFHLKGFFIGECLGLILSFLSALLIHFFL